MEKSNPTRTSQMVVLNYATSEVDIISGIPDGKEEEYFNKHYKDSECGYMASNRITLNSFIYGEQNNQEGGPD